MNTYRRVLRHRNFRYLFAGQAASVIGDQVIVVAIALFVTQLTGSPTDLGLVLGARTLPLILLLLFGGVWADRLPRHRIMIATDAIRAVLHALVAVLILTGTIRIWELVAIEAVFGAAQAFFQPAYTGLIPQTVPEELIPDARALTESVASLGFLLGSALATVLVLGLGAGAAFAVDAATFALSAALLLQVRPRPRGVERPQESVLRELAGGWREVRSRTWVWVTIAVFTGAVLCVYAQWYALAPIIARDAYGSVGVFGALEIAAGVGAVIGSVVVARWHPEHPLATGLMLVIAWPLTAGLFALSAPLAVVVAGSFATGFGFSLMAIWWETALAQYIPPAALSRVSAWDWMGSLALLPLGSVIAGPLAAAVGAQTVLGVGAVIGVVLFILVLVPRQTRELRGAPSGQQRPNQVAEERGRKPLIADIRSDACPAAPRAVSVKRS